MTWSLKVITLHASAAVVSIVRLNSLIWTKYLSGQLNLAHVTENERYEKKLKQLNKQTLVAQCPLSPGQV